MVNRYNPIETALLHYYEDQHIIPPGRLLLWTLMGKQEAYLFERREWRILTNQPRAKFRSPSHA